MIVIDHGKKIYDGDLSRIAGAGSGTRIIKFRPQAAALAAFGADWKPAHGEVKISPEGEITLHVPSQHVTTWSSSRSWRKAPSTTSRSRTRPRRYHQRAVLEEDELAAM